MIPEDVTGWDLLLPRQPLLQLVWILIGVMIGWMIRRWWSGGRR